MPSIQRAEVLTDGFLGLAALSQNRRGLAPEGGPAHLHSPRIVSGAAVEDGPAGFRARLHRRHQLNLGSIPCCDQPSPAECSFLGSEWRSARGNS